MKLTGTPQQQPQSGFNPNPSKYALIFYLNKINLNHFYLLNNFCFKVPRSPHIVNNQNNKL